jgi:hypothetical protein
MLPDMAVELESIPITNTDFVILEGQVLLPSCWKYRTALIED